MQKDADALEETLNQHGAWESARDAKLNALHALLTGTYPKRKALVFSRFANTVRYALLPITEDAVQLAGNLLREKALPATAQNDAIHAVVVTVHGVEFLLAWNFRHLANAGTRPIMRSVCRRGGYTSPEICTPSELMGDIEDG